MFRFKTHEADVWGIKLVPHPSSRFNDNFLVEDSRKFINNSDNKIKKTGNLPADDSAHLSPRHLLR